MADKPVALKNKKVVISQVGPPGCEKNIYMFITLYYFMYGMAIANTFIMCHFLSSLHGCRI